MEWVANLRFGDFLKEFFKLRGHFPTIKEEVGVLNPKIIFSQLKELHNFFC